MSTDTETQSKHEVAFNLFRITDPQKLKGKGKLSKVQEIEMFLRWAINSERPGFLVRDEVGVAAVASATKASRATVSQAINSLVKTGILRARPKAPYLIISRKPRISDNVRFAGETISITMALAGEEIEYFDALLPLHQLSPVDEVQRFIVAQLKRTPDAAEAVHEGSVWNKLQKSPDKIADSGFEILVFNRLRVTQPDPKTTNKPARPFLYELSFLCVEKTAAESLVRQVGILKNETVTSISVFKLLEHAGHIDGVVPGRNRLSVSPIDAPPHLYQRVLRLAGADLDTTGFSQDSPLLKWNYGTFLPAGKEPLLIVSVSFVDPEVLNVLVRSMDLEL